MKKIFAIYVCFMIVIMGLYTSCSKKDKIGSEENSSTNVTKKLNDSNKKIEGTYELKEVSNGETITSAEKKESTLPLLILSENGTGRMYDGQSGQEVLFYWDANSININGMVMPYEYKNGIITMEFGGKKQVFGTPRNIVAKFMSGASTLCFYEDGVWVSHSKGVIEGWTAEYKTEYDEASGNYTGKPDLDGECTIKTTYSTNYADSLMLIEYNNANSSKKKTKLTNDDFPLEALDTPKTETITIKNGSFDMDGKTYTRQ